MHSTATITKKRKKKALQAQFFHDNSMTNERTLEFQKKQVTRT